MLANIESPGPPAGQNDAMGRKFLAGCCIATLYTSIKIDLGAEAAFGNNGGV